MASTILADSVSETNEGYSRPYSVGNVFGSFVTALSLLKQPKVIAPLVMYLALKLIVVAFYLSSTTEPWITLWSVFIRGVTGENLSHYPLHLVLMQKVLGRLDIVMYIFIQIVFLGATVLLVSWAYKRRPVSLTAGISKALRSYPNLMVVALFSSALLLISVNVPGVIEQFSKNPPILAMAALASLFGLIVQAFFIYAIPSVMLGCKSAIRATGESFSITASSFIKTLVIVALPFILILPITFLEFEADVIAMRITPDFLIYMQVISEMLQFIATYLITACATVIYIWRNG